MSIMLKQEDLKRAAIVTEGIQVLYSYHLSNPDNYLKSFCGKDVMVTSFSLRQWGAAANTKDRYCERCEEIAKTKIGDEWGCLNSTMK
jgi:hypothetical protein